ncbi:unnamed protein product [Haemonchus placei]|uniref:Reverse transcriptase domain-containing protein n=1 Tax=Haemonchus placei TaxID=6290 RepID=A0A0N4WKR2_HAEPC|nr:unnamed protein product [Haemonchus placei]
MATSIGCLFIGTINSRSISTAARQIKLDHGEGQIRYIHRNEATVPRNGSEELPSGTILFHSGAETAHRGISFVVRQPLACEERFTPISDRLRTLYHPSLKEVEHACRRIPKGCAPILLADMNAKVGRYTPDAPNDRGRILTAMLTKLGLRAWNVRGKPQMDAGPPEQTPQESASEHRLSSPSESLSKITYLHLVASHTPPFAKQLEDIRPLKTIIVQKEIDIGRSMIEVQRKEVLRKRRLLINLSKTGEFPQRATEIEHFRPLPLYRDTQSSYESHLESRRQKLEESESPSQVGFRRKYFFLNKVHVLKQIAEKSAEYNFPVHVALVDYKKALESLAWSTMWTALAKRDVHPKLIDMLRRLYESSSTPVLVNTRPVTVTMQRGIKQGDTCSPKLFNAPLQMVLDSNDWEECGLSIGGGLLLSLEYADDVTWLPLVPCSKRCCNSFQMHLLRSDSTLTQKSQNY